MNTPWTENWTDRTVRVGNPAQLSTILFPLFFYLNALYLIPKFFKPQKWYLYFIVAFGVLVGAELIIGFIFVVINPLTNNFFDSYLLEISGRDNLVMGLPNSMFFAFLLSFLYRFTRDRITHQRTIQQLNLDKVSMELSLLKSQIDPHFLFNNLNALDDLIDRDKNQAKEYLHKLSSMYRYSITNMEDDVVSLEQEWNFVDDYIYLIEKRFGPIYQFEKVNEIGNFDELLIPPGSLQTLLENAVKHNIGSMDEPLKILLKATSEGLIIQNKLRLKKSANDNLGTGLKNLRSRYKLLSNQEIDVKQGTDFIVKLPLIKQVDE